MNREIKFRAWDEVHNYMIKDFHLKNIFQCVITKDKDYCENDEDMHGYVVEQFTGLKDKNGVEVYEGDKIEWEGHNILFEVEWSQEDCGFVCHDNLTLCCGSMNQEYLDNFTIIGNIHQDKDIV